MTIKKIILPYLIIFMLLISGNIITPQESSIHSSEKDNEIMQLIENYEELVKNNAKWEEKDLIIKKIKRYIDSNYHNAIAYEVLVKWYYDNYPIKSAITYGQKAIDISNKVGEVFFTRNLVYYMGLCYMKKGTIDYGKALGYFNIVNGIGKDDYSTKAILFYNMGICYRELYNVREYEIDKRFLYLSEVSFEFAAFLENNIENHYQLGYTYELLGDYKKALKSYNDALEINPSFSKVVLAKKNLLNKMPNN